MSNVTSSVDDVINSVPKVELEKLSLHFNFVFDALLWVKKSSRNSFHTEKIYDKLKFGTMTQDHVHIDDRDHCVARIALSWNDNVSSAYRIAFAGERERDGKQHDFAPKTQSICSKLIIFQNGTSIM